MGIKCYSVYTNSNIGVNRCKITVNSFSFLYSMGLLTCSYMERMFASSNFLRGVNYCSPVFITHIDEWVFRKCEPRWGFIKYHTNLYFYNPLSLLMSLKLLALFLIELASNYGSIVYLSTAQYNLPMHYMLRWYSRNTKQSCIGTVWQCGTLSSIHSRFLKIRTCIALPYQSYKVYMPHWRVTFGQIILLIKILRNYFYNYEYYGRVRKEINKLRKIFKMFYYYRYIESYSYIDAVLLLEPVYRRSYRMIKEVNNSLIPAIGSCSISNTALWYDYWLPLDSCNPASNIFVTSYISNALSVGYKLRGLSLFLKNTSYNNIC